MAFTGIYALLGFKLSSYFKPQRYIHSSIATGAIIPSIDILLLPLFLLLDIEGSTSSWSHSVFTISILTLSLFALSEYKKNSIYRQVGKGLAIGMLLHVVLDLILSSENVYIFWPLPINRFSTMISTLSNMNIIFYLIDFFFIRLLASFMLNSILITNIGHRWIAIALSYLMSLQLYFILLFILLFFAGASHGSINNIFLFASSLQLIFIVSCVSLLSINFERLYKKEKQL
ncbi:MAG: hypothetical protein CBD58_04180 [bacterium TMED198]|nr:MAG: hypothetical protein CBD58_04180 [bacterium TMED198]|tara:strand:- start:179 stop:871 length:693 start_codon:yes stop_codon:yes gene_type:complete